MLFEHAGYFVVLLRALLEQCIPPSAAGLLPPASAKWQVSACIPWATEEQHEPHGLILHCSPKWGSLWERWVNSVSSVSELFQQQKQVKVLFVNRFIVVHRCWKYWHLETLPDANQGPSSNEWPACKSRSPSSSGCSDLSPSDPIRIPVRRQHV